MAEKHNLLIDKLGIVNMLSLLREHNGNDVDCKHYQILSLPSLHFGLVRTIGTFYHDNYFFWFSEALSKIPGKLWFTSESKFPILNIHSIEHFEIPVLPDF